MVSTDEVYGSLGPTGLFTEKTPLDPSSPVLGFQGLGRPHHPGLRAHLRARRGRHPLLEQLRALPVPREADSPDGGQRARTTSRCRSTATARTCATGCTSRITARRSRWRLEKGKKGGVYNIGGSSERENIQIVRGILAPLGKPETLIKYVTDRPGHDRRYAIDATKMRTELGWTPAHTFEKGLAETVKWYVDQSALVGARDVGRLPAVLRLPVRSSGLS